MSSPDASGDTPLPSGRPLAPSLNSHQPTRKAPPSPLAISSSSLSPHSPNKPPHSSSSSPNVRHSLESSHSDFTTSVRSDVSSLLCSEFPIPPSALPPIPASPQTPKSLYFSTTPTTPRSRSPLLGSLPLQDPSRGSGRSLLATPKSLKGFFSGPRSAGQSQFASQQDQSSSAPSVPSEPHASRSLEDLHGYEPSGESVPVRYSQNAVYNDSGQSASLFRPVTLTTAGAQTHQDWVSSSGESSPLQPPQPAYIKDDLSALPHSPSRGSSFETQKEQTKQFGSRNHSPAPQLPASPPPPRSPLPVPPTKRDSARDSDRYSHIARKAGIIDMGMNTSEEQLLSTDFITEMLKQPGEI